MCTPLRARQEHSVRAICAGVTSNGLCDNNEGSHFVSKILVTGASGFIGTRLCTLLREQGHTVFGVSSGAEPYPQGPNFSLENSEAVWAAVAHADPDIVIHLAALATVTGNKASAYYEINALGSERLIKAVDHLGRRIRFIFVSTAGVYGNQPSNVLSEDMPPLPVHHYGLSKFVAERLTVLAAERHDITIVRPFNVIGSGQRADFIVPKLVDHFIRRAPVVRLGNVDVIRDYINLDAACSILIEAIGAPATFGEVVNLCSGRGTKLRELLENLTELTGHEIEIEAAPEFTRKNEVWHLVGSVEKLDRLLPNRLPPLPVRDVLAQMLT
ncbi:NAD(P)-dependent oxidoreductase [Mesorhizobium sp. B2-5-4]|nr:NAD(P)-dependent oxidoreductase [Mesorhizobium sp. B2-5-4]